jgi:parallel beta-helix repeat protein
LRLDKKGAFCTVLLFILISTYAFAFNIQPAKAESSAGTISIMPDGSISPSTANITTLDNVTYTFTGNNYLPIDVNRSNIIINGMGHTLQTYINDNRPPGIPPPLLLYYTIGFSLTGVSNVTIKNTTITDNDQGVYLYNSSGNVLSGNNITANSLGIWLYSSSSNVLSGNNVTANSGLGIWLFYSSDNNTLVDNNATANGYGIELDYSSNNVLSGNVMVNNTYSFGITGGAFSDFMNHIDTLNLVDGKPVYYLMNQSNIVITPKTYPWGVGYLSLVNCKNVTVQDLTLTHNMQGLTLAFTNNSKIIDNNITANSGYGVEFDSSSGNVLSGNRVIANSNDGVDVYYSDNNTLSGNKIAANGFDGIDLYSCDNNTSSANNITSNNGGVILDSSSGNVFSSNNITGQGDGFDIWYSSGNVLSGNDVAGDGYDNGLSFYSSNSSIISGNIIANNVYGIVIHVSSSNSIYHNDFVDNTQQVSSDGSPNTWDNGYPSGGNYWSDYQTRYPDAVANISSGIWNASYVIDVNNTDSYPLVAPFKSFNVAWNNQTYCVDTVSYSLITDLNFNATAKTLIFNVTGTTGLGFCRVTIPKSLMWCDNESQWVVVLRGENGFLYSKADLNIMTDANYTYICFLYSPNTNQVSITSTSAVPEFQPSMLLPLFMIITLLGAMILKRNRKVKK